MSKIKAIFTLCFDDIVSHTKAFPAVTERVERRTSVKFDQLAAQDETIIGNWMQTYWEELPDNPSIHREGFIPICNCAELYCFENDTDEGIGEGL